MITYNEMIVHVYMLYEHDASVELVFDREDGEMNSSTV